jgi:hypothetical protein
MPLSRVITPGSADFVFKYSTPASLLFLLAPKRFLALVMSTAELTCKVHSTANANRTRIEIAVMMLVRMRVMRVVRMCVVMRNTDWK